MFCKRCGSSLQEGTIFCSNCGEKIESNETNNISNSNPTNTFNSLNSANSSQQKPDNASLVIGIISIVLSFIFSVLIIPLAIIGLVVGISKKPRNMVGIVLNGIAIVLPIIFIVVAVNSPEFQEALDKFRNEITTTTSSNAVAGKYNCTGVDDHKDEYLITLHLNDDMTFLYGPYGKLTNNYAKGTYTYEDEQKTNASGQYKYYMVTLTGSKDDFVIEGKPSDKDFNSKMEFGLTNTTSKKQGVVMFVSSYNTYYCYEE